MKTEIIVIGAGIAGCSTAYFLARRGHKVTILEKNPGVGLEASGRPCCGVRQHGRKAALQLAMGSVHIWATLADELGTDVGYVRTGNLKVRFNEPDLAVLEVENAWEHEQGLSEVRMMTKKECLEIIPGLSETIVGGKYCPTDGIANPMLVCPAIARGAARLGADVRVNIAVTGLLTQGSRVCGVTTNQGELEGDVVVNTAGPWAMKFNEMVGYYTPIRPHPTQLIITERLPRKFTPWLGFGIGAVEIVQPKSGNMVIGVSRPPKPAYTYQKGVRFEYIARGSNRIIELLPWLADVLLLRSFAGLTETTPDTEPYIGQIPGVEGYFMACGFSGQGFCLGPMVGKVLSELIEGHEPSVPLEKFKPDRFSYMKWPEFELLT